MDEFFEETQTLTRSQRKRSRKSPKLPPNNKTTPVKKPLELIQVNPKTENQKKAFLAYKQNKNLLLYGTAGTGKSYISLYMALKSVLNKENEFNKIVIVRSATSSKDLGHLPGSIKEKTRIYELPYISICAELFNRADAYDILTKQNIIEFTSTSYLRGTTFKNSIIIYDEFQNGNPAENDTVVTRIGDNCRVIACGDTRQTDLNKPHEVSGGSSTIKIMSNMKSFESVQFNVDDIVRSGIVREWILSKEKLGY
jgi:phosphate starvation-inducible protein PhoH